MEKVKNFAKHFWHGVLSALKGLAFLAMLVLSVALLFIIVVLLSHVGVVACEHFGNWFVLIYLLDMVALYSLVADLISMDKPENKKVFTEILRRTLMFVLAIAGLFILNWLLLVIGKIPAMLFGQCWSVGFTICSGLFICLIALMIWGLIEYIKEYGTKALGETVFKASGFLTVIVILAVIVALILC